MLAASPASPPIPPATVLTVAVAQSASVAGDVDANVDHHVQMLREAAGHGARVVVFPELSLTGYELSSIRSDPALTLSADDTRLDPLRASCSELGVTALVGAPWTDGAERSLAAVALTPGGGVEVYAKRHLFDAESQVFAPGRAPLVLDVDGHTLVAGICADLADGEQVAEVRELQADAWVLGVLLSPTGYAADAGRAARAARTSGATVLLANHAAPTGGWDSAGRSGTWRPDGTGQWLDDDRPPAPGVLVVPIDRRQR